MKLVQKSISLAEVKEMALKNIIFGQLVKAVVDIERRIMVLDGDMHADEEKYLLDHGSKQDDLWGINLYPKSKNFVEFDSVINIRPRINNFTRGVDDKKTRKKIIEIVNNLIKK